jgi:hypothetical protein
MDKKYRSRIAWLNEKWRKGRLGHQSLTPDDDPVIDISVPTKFDLQKMFEGKEYTCNPYFFGELGPNLYGSWKVSFYGKYHPPSFGSRYLPLTSN